MKLGAIVEGHGEEDAIPILVRRLAAWLDPALNVEVLPPHRVPRGKLDKEDEVRRAVEALARKTGPGAPILIVMDADDAAACVVGPRVLQWARAARCDREIGVVVAVREFEAWFLAAARSLSGLRGLPAGLGPVPDAEGHHNPKAWLDTKMLNGYSESLDQPALTAAMNLEEARCADSFDKLVRDLGRLIGRTPPPRSR